MTPQVLWMLGVTLPLMLSACGNAGEETSQGAGTSTPKAVPIAFTRSGGIAGVQHRLQVDTRGRWIYQEQGERVTRGTFSASRFRKLQRLGRSSELETFSKDGLDQDVCPDAFNYSLTVGRETLTWGTCQARPSQALRTMTGLLVEHTPM